MLERGVVPFGQCFGGVAAAAGGAGISNCRALEDLAVKHKHAVVCLGPFSLSVRPTVWIGPAVGAVAVVVRSPPCKPSSTHFTLERRELVGSDWVEVASVHLHRNVSRDHRVPREWEQSTVKARHPHHGKTRACHLQHDSAAKAIPVGTESIGVDKSLVSKDVERCRSTRSQNQRVLPQPARLCWSARVPPAPHPVPTCHVCSVRAHSGRIHAACEHDVVVGVAVVCVHTRRNLSKMRCGKKAKLDEGGRAGAMSMGVIERNRMTSQSVIARCVGGWVRRGWVSG
jgi:hypothetical protein